MPRKPIKKATRPSRRSPRLTPRSRAADLRLRRTYGLTLAEYLQVFTHQGKCCAICKRPVPPGKPRLAVDHRHECGKLRGLLCWHCNRAIAVFRDDVTLLLAAVEYLTRPPVSVVFGKDRYTAPGRVGSKKRARLLKQMQQNGTHL